MQGPAPRPAGGGTTVVSLQDVQSSEPEPLVLRLRERASITWNEEVVDNEHLGRQKSNSRFSLESRCSACL